MVDIHLHYNDNDAMAICQAKAVAPAAPMWEGTEFGLNKVEFEIVIEPQYGGRRKREPGFKWEVEPSVDNPPEEWDWTLSQMRRGRFERMRGWEPTEQRALAAARAGCDDMNRERVDQARQAHIRKNLVKRVKY